MRSYFAVGEDGKPGVYRESERNEVGLMPVVGDGTAETGKPRCVMRRGLSGTITGMMRGEEQDWPMIRERQ